MTFFIRKGRGRKNSKALPSSPGEKAILASALEKKKASFKMITEENIICSWHLRRKEGKKEPVGTRHFIKLVYFPTHFEPPYSNSGITEKSFTVIKNSISPGHRN